MEGSSSKKISKKEVSAAVEQSQNHHLFENKFYEDGNFVGQEIKIDELITIKTDDENPALMDLLQAFAAQGARAKDGAGYGIQYECSICHKKFLSEKVAQMHQLQMHNDYNIIPNDYNRDTKSSYKCQKCGVEFDATNFKVFLHHRKMIHKEYPYGCSICLNTFQSIGFLIKHRKQYHQIAETEKEIIMELEKVYERNCQNGSLDVVTIQQIPAFENKPVTSTITSKVNVVCDPLQVEEMPKNIEGLQVNLVETDGNSNLKIERLPFLKPYEKSFDCKVCGRSCPSVIVLNRHMRTHTGERPFSCETCGKSFGDSSTLVCHRRIHTGEKPYRCNICGKCFAYTSSVHAHKKTHERERQFMQGD